MVNRRLLCALTAVALLPCSASTATMPSSIDAAPRPRILRPPPGAARARELWNETVTTPVGTFARSTKQRVVGGVDRLKSISPLGGVKGLSGFGFGRGSGGSDGDLDGGGGGGGGGEMQATIDQLVARSWKFLLEDKLWGSPVIDGSDGQVWKHWLPKETYGRENSVVKARGIVKATPEEIFNMIFDSSRTKEYNKYSVGRTDIVSLSPFSKVVWNRTNPPGTKKPHDFCTLMHGVPSAAAPKGNGTYLLMTTAVEHPQAEPSSTYLRSEILLGVNLMRPVPGRPGFTELTTVNHVKTTGVPAFLAEKVAARSAIDFIRKVDDVLGGGGGGGGGVAANGGRKKGVSAPKKAAVAVAAAGAGAVYWTKRRGGAANPPPSPPTAAAAAAAVEVEVVHVDDGSGSCVDNSGEEKEEEQQQEEQVRF